MAFTFNGTDDDDLIGGTIFDDIINGFGGDDFLFGYDGTDILSGGGESDFLKGGVGTDFLFGGSGADILISGDRNATRDPRFGGNDTLDGGSGNDQLIVSTDSHSVQIIGGTGTDVLVIGDGDFTAFLNGVHDDEPFNPEKAARIDLAAGTGHYELEVLGLSPDGRVSIIDIDLDITGVENVFGSAFSEFISGDSGANNIQGRGGNDTLEGRGGADTLDGGTGRDRAIYDTSIFAIDIDLQRATQIGGDAQGDILISIEDIDGSRTDDTIRGNSASNELFGNLGNDFLEGRGGADTLNGGAGRDLAFYQNSDAAIDVDLQRATQIGGEAQGDILISIEDVGGTLLNDVIRGNSANNELSGGFGNDTLEGRIGNDTLIGGFGNDILNGGAGNDVLDGGRGTDTVTLVDAAATVVKLGLDGADGSSVAFIDTDILRSIENVVGSSFFDTITGNEQDNVLDGGAGDDIIRGGDGDDTLIGGTGRDDLFGEDGDDILDGGAGGGFINGGDGIDTLICSAGSLVTLDGLAAGTLTEIVGTSFVRTSLASIENVIGSSFGDTIIGNDKDNVIDGGLGNDSINGRGGIDTVSLANHAASTVILGQNGGSGSVVNFRETDVLLSIENVIGSIFSDNITGNEVGNTLDGGSGADTLDGRNGDDILIGGIGNDTYLFSGNNFGSDRIIDAGDIDTAKFDFSTIESVTRVGNDLVADLTTGTFTVVNHFAGGQVENAQDAFTGRVVTLAVGLTGGDASGIIAGTDKGETLDGRGGNDLLYGNGGKDTLLGGEGDDLLDGGQGKDVLEGGNGNDTLFGGKGDDTFVFACNSGNDVIKDFDKGQDQIDLAAFNTTFRSLDDDHDGRLENGEGDSHIAINVSHGDTVLTFEGGSIRIEDVMGLGQKDFLL